MADKARGGVTGAASPTGAKLEVVVAFIGAALGPKLDALWSAPSPRGEDGDPGSKGVAGNVIWLRGVPGGELSC